MSIAIDSYTILDKWLYKQVWKNVETTGFNKTDIKSHVIGLDKFSNFSKLVRVMSLCLKFKDKLKLKVKQKHRDLFGEFDKLKQNYLVSIFKTV